MGYKIGVPSLKLNNVGNRSKHCGSFGGVAYEALGERKGRDMDINPELTANNIYTGYQTAEALMEYSANHLKELKDASGRGIRRDAVVMCATIFKPPAAYMNTLSTAEQQRFLGDCLAFFEPVVGAQNIKSTAQHYDELGAHLHIFWEPMTSDGRLCAKEIHNIKLFGYINEHLPAYLRERGWDIDNCDCYDRAQRDREKLEDENGAKQRKKGGRTSAAYKLEAEQQRQNLVRENEKLNTENSNLLGSNGLLAMENERLREQNAELQRQQTQLSQEAAAAQKKNRELEKELAEQQQAFAHNDAIILAQEEALGLIQTIEEYDEEAANLMDTMDLAEASAVELPKAAKLFELPDALNFVQRMKDMLSGLRKFIDICIIRLRIFERTHFVPEPISVPAQQRANALDNTLSNAFSRAASSLHSRGNHSNEIPDGR